MNILDAAARRLSSAKFTAVLGDDEVHFEDASVLGFVKVFASVALLLSGWHEAQDQFLRDNAAALRRDRRKSWNAYSILLTSERAADNAEHSLISIEEDFQATRKIVRAGVSMDVDVENALAVLLPIRQRVRLVAEDAVGRIADRLSALPSEAAQLLLHGGSSEEFADALLRSEENE